MKRFIALLAALAALAGFLASCAVTNPGVQPVRSMPAARAALRPEYRIFYDTLQDYGDWVLIEPAGYVFRPRVEFHDWRPYESGFWAPSDSYGWVWISSEPYGWATYHYGRWVYDDFQGWVWMPGVDWGPAWVGWQTTDHYVGWTPLAPGSGFIPRTASMPGGQYVYAAVDQMGSTDLQLKRESEIGDEAARARPVENAAVVDGVRVPIGPSIERIERATGRTIARVKITDLLPRAGGGSIAPKASGDAEAPAAGRSFAPEEARRAGEQAAREAQGVQAHSGPMPARVTVVRPFGGPRLRNLPAGRDTSRATGGD